jgi:hypothetical protein
MINNINSYVFSIVAGLLRAIIAELEETARLNKHTL